MTTTTTFIGDIKFNDGETDRLVSDLATVDEVNEALGKYYDKTQCDSKFALKGESGNQSNAYTKTECDSKFALKEQQHTSYELVQYEFYYRTDRFGWVIMCNEGANLIIDGTINGLVFHFEDVIYFGTDATININGIDFSVNDVWTDNLEHVMLIVDDTKRLEITSVKEYKEITRLVNVVYDNEVYTKTECDDKFVLKSESGNSIDAYTKTECDDKFALKSNDYIDKIMSLSTSSYSSETTYKASVGDRFRLGVRIGGGATQYYTVTLYDEFKTTEGQEFGVDNYYFTITYNPTYTRLSFKPNSNNLVLSSLILEAPNKVVYDNEITPVDSIFHAFAPSDPNPGMTPEAWNVIDSFEYTDEHVLSSQATKLLVDKTVRQSNTTITHYAPIEEPIANYQIGHPTFMSGKVYKRVENNWTLSTSSDTTDCICSCITHGTSKTFIGVITSIDAKQNSITFATHGDYLFKVSNSSKYNIGDAICYDGSVIDVNTIPTIAIQQSIIGKVSSIVDDKTLAVFKTM